MGDSNGVGYLNQNTSCQTSVNNRFCNPSSSVGGRSVYFSVVLSREGSTSVSAPSSVSIDNDLTASQTGIGLGTADNEAARGLDVIDGLSVK